MPIQAKIIPMEWESDFFALSTAKLIDVGNENSTIIDARHFNDYQRIQAKINSSDYKAVDILSNNGFSFIEGEVSFTFLLDAFNQTIAQPDYFFAESTNIVELKVIASSAFEYSRFRAPWYSLAENARFYAYWVEKAVNGLFDDCCLLIKNRQNQIQGFITLKYLANGEARIGLIAVAENARQQGVGSNLMHSAFYHCLHNNINQLHVATQIANISAIRLYSKLGAILAETNYWFYR